MNLLKFFQNLDNIISYILSNEANESKFLRNFFKKKKIILVDAGSNLGGYLEFIENNFEINKAYMFEPSRKCISYLIKKLNNQKKYQIIKKGLSNKNKKVNFFEYNVLSQSSIYKKKNYYNKNLSINKKYQIKCTSLDKFYIKNKLSVLIDILKIDCQGEDLNILKGSKYLLSKKKIKLIKIEIENNKNMIKIINLLDIMGYQLVTITKKKFYKEKLFFLMLISPTQSI